MIKTFYEYGYFNETEKDKVYYMNLYKKRGFTAVTVKRIKTDTKGLKMYEITATQEEPKTKTKQEKTDTVKKMNNVDLLKLFAEYTVKFDPLDEYLHESYEVITHEILSRMTDVV